ISAAKTKKLKKEIAQQRGIKGMPALSRVGSLNYARGVPWDFMHLLFENIAEYYKHFEKLVNIMKMCTQFSITHTEVNQLEQGLESWVKKYEKIYYQYDIKRLSTCTLTVHALLHLADNIRFCGPVWTTWTFWVERYCGYLQAGLKSKVAPWANLNNRILHKAYLEQIDIYYNLMIISDECEYFVHMLQNQSVSDIKKKLPVVMKSWGKVRIANGGDMIRTSSAANNPDNQRDMSYVRYEVIVEDADGEESREIFYGQMHRVLQCTLPDKSFWDTYRGKMVLLAVITPCMTKGMDAAKKLTTYKDTTTTIVTDVRAVSSVVGQVRSRKKWGIVDRSGEYARTDFIARDDQWIVPELEGQ
ncbi:hypothetical protein HYPSUDRAFT_151076, partial [Hypholoma sublateritium FD-334 SS-4]